MGAGRSFPQSLWLTWAGVVPGDQITIHGRRWTIGHVGQGEWSGWVELIGASGIRHCGQVNLSEVIEVSPVRESGPPMSPAADRVFQAARALIAQVLGGTAVR